MKQKTLIYAGRLERLFANLIDSILLVLLSGVVTALLRGHGLAVLGMFICSATYYSYFTAGAWQATPGKRLLGMYVIRTDRRAVSQRDALERFLAYSIPSLPLYTSLVAPEIASIMFFWLSLFWFAPILFTDERMGYHDRLCKTRVVVGKVDV